MVKARNKVLHPSANPVNPNKVLTLILTLTLTLILTLIQPLHSP